jgi:hypothetical protein
MVSRICEALSITTVNKINIHPALVSHLPILLFLTLTPFANLYHFLIALSHFLFNTLWLAVFYYANSLFLTGISIMIYSFLICAQFFRMPLGCKQTSVQLFMGTCVELQIQCSVVVSGRDTRLEVISECMCCTNTAHCSSVLMWCSNQCKCFDQHFQF